MKSRSNAKVAFRASIAATDVRCAADQVERRSQFDEEKIWCGDAVRAPPSRRFRGSVRLLQVWFGPAASPVTTQLVQNGGRWPETARLGGVPGGRQRLVQGATLLVGKVVTVIVRD
jgi:hypothetical protein